MILRRHVPSPSLARFIEFFWYYEGWEGSHARERVLPDGTFELIINLREEPRKLFDRTNPARYTAFQRGWISGTHAEHIEIDTVPGASMIGAHFKPGGAAPFLEFLSSEFRDSVVPFEAVWGSPALEAREQLLAAGTISGKFEILENFLRGTLHRCSSRKRPHEAIAWATDQFCRQPHAASMATVANQLGMSHKHFIQRFREQVGLAPKLFCRIRRFQEVLVQVNRQQRINWAEVACQCGYFDQSHLVSDFLKFSGLNPSSYECLDADYASFVPRQSRR